MLQQSRTSTAAIVSRSGWVWAGLVLINMPVCLAYAWGSNFFKGVWQVGLLLPAWLMFTAGWNGLEAWLAQRWGQNARMMLRGSALGVAALQAVPVLQLWTGLLAAAAMELTLGNIHLRGVLLQPLSVLLMIALNGVLLSLFVLLLAGLSGLLVWGWRRMGWPLRSPVWLLLACWLLLLGIDLSLRHSAAPLFGPVPNLLMLLLS
ncbi:hypothetical protein [Leeia aquatica]|uniref:Uncharacterized protein n=1 Tax=Leeia aquatica TaxID=2725557 RepID=A0A847SF28_9NEIS|nr:hypothetical protein [Leeia aquatica]NLR74552.1 hypothetical protein [Leeia aquatica]